VLLVDDVEVELVLVEEVLVLVLLVELDWARGTLWTQVSQLISQGQVRLTLD
jgi:hypothetical protein